MKIIFRTPLLIIFLFISFTSTQAATITWLGGNGAWEDPSEWDTGTAPSYGDDVIIPSGYCRIYGGDHEGATSVEVHSSARLYIYEGGQLEIQGAVDNDGLHNNGRVYIYGILAINDISRTNTSSKANAIRNDKYIFTYSNSVVNIKYIEDDAIHNTTTISYFRVRGALYITSVDERAIYNEGRFYNYGTVDISNSGVNTLYLMVSNHDLRNLSGGIINLNSNIYGGLSNSSANGSVRNYGNINIDNVGIGINNHGTLTNYSGATIDAQNNNATSYHNRLGATITNHDKMKSHDSGSGIYNYGDLYNYNSFWVFGSTANGSVRNFSTGFIDNYHDLYLSATSYRDINNQGDITNRNGGIIEINKSIDMSAGSSISNYGFIASHGNEIHNISGSFGNKGVIDDNQGLLQGLFPNDRLIIAPVSGPMQVGVPYPNVLDVASLDGLSIGNWKISQTGVVAGIYNESTNVFTPNANAAGISTIYISVQDLASGFARNFSLEIGNPILPFTGKKQLASTRNGLADGNSDFESAKVQAFPNPNMGTIHLQSDAFIMNNTQVQIFNNLGQLVQEEKLASGSMTQSLDIAYQLANGFYFVKILQEGKEIDVKRIQLHR